MALARFVALELPLQSLTKKDIVKCLVGVKNSKILSLSQRKLWIELQFFSLQAIEVNKSF